jgi:flagella basal body P-ring formation protein FlgA
MVLWMEEGHVRIHIPVVALDAGKQGELIRVATADLRNTFRAIVLDAGNAEGVKE